MSEAICGTERNPGYRFAHPGYIHHADALILDLEDSVAANRKAGARETALAYLKQHGGERRQSLVVRVRLRVL